MLSHRERCIRSILLEDPDRIPLSLNIRKEVLDILKETLNVTDTGITGYIKVCRKLGIDTLNVSLKLKGGYLPRDAKIKEGPYGPAYTIGHKDNFEVRRDIWGVESLWAPAHTYTYTFSSHPLKIINLKDYIWPEIGYESIDYVRKFRKRYENYCLRGSVTHMWEIAWQLVGFNEIIVMMFKKPFYVKRVLNELHKLRIEEASILCDEGVDVIIDGDDVGTQKGMMMSPEMWRLYLKPKYAELIDLCHKKGAFLHFHSDGWIEPIIDDLVEIGVDILNPVQPECMSPSRLKELYGDKLCFDGTIGVQSTLPFGTPQDVAREVKDRIYSLGPTGLILGPTHAMQPDVPIENILTMYKVALKYGRNARKM
ncbi:TPA: hypothetical protein EYP70_07695 [Candidatus Bathyarchaeota archaeon]|nr:hypothetical protein [Candidatus Bathyarchaeota archaeon]